MLTNSPLIFTLLISFGINMFFYAFAALFKTDKVTDLTYSLSFFLLSGILFFWLGIFSESRKNSGNPGNSFMVSQVGKLPVLSNTDNKKRL